MIDVPVEDLVFVVCALIGCGLLLTVLLDDILGASFHFDIGGVSLVPRLLSFVTKFGVGGLFATQAFDVHGGQAAAVGSGFGVVGLPGIKRLGLLRLAELEKTGPRPPRTMWRVAKGQLDDRYDQLTIGELIDRYSGR